MTQSIQQTLSPELAATREHVRAPTAASIAAGQTLGRIAGLLTESRARMATITPLLPPALRAQVQGGIPEEGKEWSLFVPGAATATRVRQLLPTLLEALQRAGHDVPQLRVKVRAPHS